ncbi:MAG: hypothetical protein Q9186_002806 [Xanthomendoza sp. 1 TL-2023]
MEQNPSLGTLTPLPKELRDQIWEYMSVNRHFAFLQSSKQIHNEASTRMEAVFRDVILTFNIEPKYQYQSWLSVESSFNAKWSLQNVDHAIALGFGELPFERLRSLKINIKAPDKHDPGQIVCLYKKCLDMAALLQVAKDGLPALEINLVDSASAAWSSKGEPQQSVDFDRAKHYLWHGGYHPMSGFTPTALRRGLYDADDNDTWITQDNLTVLYAFARLRNARSVTINEPADSPPNGHFYENLADALMRKTSLGTYLDPDDVFDDATLQEDIDLLYMDLDLELDMLRGETANKLRLDRFASWYSDKNGGESKYEKEYDRILKSWTDEKEIARRMWSFCRRFTLMRIFNPIARENGRPPSPQPILVLAMLERLTQYDEEKDSDAENDSDAEEADDAKSVDDMWNQDEWHRGDYCWPKGIPPFNSEPLWEATTLKVNRIPAPYLRTYCQRKLHCWSYDRVFRGDGFVYSSNYKDL